MSERDSNGVGEEASSHRLDRWPSLCKQCLTAFEDDPERCPSCGSRAPESGWHRTRNFPEAWLGRLVEGRYRLCQRLGRGTTGSVYRAKRPQLDDSYAVKIIDLRNADCGERGRSLRERVEREVRILSSLSSPHVVDFYDYIELPEGVVAVVMDLVEGRTLKDVVHDAGPLETDRALQIGIDVATGLRRAHSRGAVHRDLKPDNIMLRELSGSGELAELIDFGIAHVGADVDETVGFIGTPRYASPEQVHGENLDHRSDIYNLGMVLFHSLTGRPPFTHSSVNELLAAQSRESPPTLQEVTPELDPPPELEDLVACMLAKSPDDRPADLDVVLERLREVQKIADSDRQTSGDPAHGFQSRETSPTRPLGGSPSTDDFGAVDEPATERSQTDASPERDHPFAERPPSDVYDVVDDETLIFRDDENTIRIRKPNDDRDERLVTPSSPVTCLSAEGPCVVVGQENGSVAVVDESKANLRRLHSASDDGAVASVSENADCTRFVAGYEGGAVYLGGLEEGWQRLGGGASVVSVALHDDGDCVAVARDDRTTEIFILTRSSEAPVTRLEHDRIPESVSFSPDGYLVAVDFLHGEVELYSAPTGRRLGTTTGTSLQMSSVFDEAES